MGDYLEINYNDALTSIDLPALTTVDNLYITDNVALTSLAGLSVLSVVGSDLELYDNACLDPAEAQAFALGISVLGNIDVHDNGANYPCP